MKNYFLFLFLFFAFSFAKGQVVINEYSAANYDSFQDNYSEYEDWIEFYNTSGTPIDLNGYYLSDKATNLTKWQFPSSFIVPAGNAVIVFCSGRDEIVGANAHTNFKLTQTKGNEGIYLSDASGLVVIDSLSLNPNQKGDSRGRTTNGAANWSVFQTPTPGGNNVGAMQEYATTPVFSQSGGYNSAAVNLTLSSPDPNITIYYTTNGDEPNNGSIVYSGAINIATTTVVKAIAYSTTANIPPSFIDYHTFFINDTHTIPILSVSGDSVDVLIEDGVRSLGSWPNQSPHKPKGTMEWFDKNGLLIDKGTGEFNKHGNDSWFYDQRGFDYIMRDQFGYNYALKDKLFMTKNRDKFQRIILKAAANDNFSEEGIPNNNFPGEFGGAHIRDAYVHHLSQLADLRLDERSYTSCIVYLNGNYWGVYDLREKVDDADFTNYYYNQDNGEVDFLKTWGATWSELPHVEPADPIVMANWDTMRNFITGNPMNQANYNIVKSQFNTGSLIDYFLLNSYVVCMDWLNWNTAWWRGRNPNGDKKKWRYTLWDMDATFNHYINYTSIPNTAPTADPCDPSTLGNPGSQGHVPIWNALLTNQEFHDDYLNRWQDLANGPFSCTYMVTLLDSMINIIAPEMSRQISTWGPPGATLIDWETNVDSLRAYILARCDSMNSAFVNCDTAITGIFDVTVEIIGIGEVEMSNSNIINDLNTPFTDQRFGGIALPFEVKSGSFDHWEVISSTAYVYDPNVDTLVLDLQGDVTVQAYFVPPVEYRDIVYEVVPTGTTTTIDANGTVINTFLTTETYVLGDTVSLMPTIDPLYYFSHWEADSSMILPNTSTEQVTFYADYTDIIRLHTILKPTITSFISGGDTLCANESLLAEVSVDFSGISPFTFVYEIDGIAQTSIPSTFDNPYIIYTRQAGTYTLLSYEDATGVGVTSGSAYVVENLPSIAQFNISPDVLTINYPRAHFVDNSIGNIVSWMWNFGDNTFDSLTSSPYHLYADSASVYQITMIVTDENNCKDTTFNQLWVKDEYWLYIPNSFTPDLDGINDKFCINYHAIREETFSFNVFNRIGELIFSTGNIHELDCENGWDGNHKESGEEVPMGTYVYEIFFKDFDGWKHQDFGHINIIR